MLSNILAVLKQFFLRPAAVAGSVPGLRTLAQDELTAVSGGSPTKRW